MEHDGNVVVFITAGTGEEARKVGHALLEHRAAACVNIAPNITSIFLLPFLVVSRYYRLTSSSPSSL